MKHRQLEYSFLWFSSSIGITSVITISLWETSRIIIEARVCRKSEMDSFTKYLPFVLQLFLPRIYQVSLGKIQRKYELYYFLDPRTLFCELPMYDEMYDVIEIIQWMEKSWCNLRFNLEWFLSGFAEYTFQFSYPPLWLRLYR